MREKPKDHTRLLHILEAIDNLFEFTNGIGFEKYRADKVLRIAVIKNLKIIEEAAYLLTKEFKSAHPMVEWNAIIGMRHVLVHGYYQIRDEIVWETIHTELKPLRENVLCLIKELEANGNINN